MAEIFLRNGDVRLHVLDDGGDQARVPLLIVPGLAESADDYADLIDHLAPRRCVAVTLRGRGRSDAPPAGYTLEEHAGDIAAAAGLIASERFCLLAFSRGVAYALGYAVAHAPRIGGLILGDYSASHSALSPEFPDRFLKTVWRGKPAAERIAAHALKAIQREAREVWFWNDLGLFDCPALILHGAAEKGSLLSSALADRYRDRLRDANVTALPASGHDLREPSAVPFNEAVEKFLSMLDTGHVRRDRS